MYILEALLISQSKNQKQKPEYNNLLEFVKNWKVAIYYK
jgi:hypothetical protein